MMEQQVPNEGIACNLAPANLRMRLEEVIMPLFRAAQHVRELNDGYAFGFADDTYTPALTDFIVSERRCCSFFRFELIFEPHNGETWLYIRGSDEVKVGLRQEFGSLLDERG